MYQIAPLCGAGTGTGCALPKRSMIWVHTRFWAPGLRVSKVRLRRRHSYAIAERPNTPASMSSLAVNEMKGSNRCHKSSYMSALRTQMEARPTNPSIWGADPEAA